jgi:hypothetical protein
MNGTISIIPVQATVNCLSGRLYNSFIGGLIRGRVATVGFHHVNTGGPCHQAALIQNLGLHFKKFTFSCALLFYQRIRSNKNKNYVRSEVFTAVTMKTMQTAATCSRRFLARGFFYPEDEGDTFLRNVGSHKIYTAPHPRRRHSSSTKIIITLPLQLQSEKKY